MAGLHLNAFLILVSDQQPFQPADGIFGNVEVARGTDGEPAVGHEDTPTQPAAMKDEVS